MSEAIKRPENIEAGLRLDLDDQYQAAAIISLIRKMAAHGAELHPLDAVLQQQYDEGLTIIDNISLAAKMSCVYAYKGFDDLADYLHRNIPKVTARSHNSLTEFWRRVGLVDDRYKAPNNDLELALGMLTRQDDFFNQVYAVSNLDRLFDIEADITQFITEHHALEEDKDGRWNADYFAVALREYDFWYGHYDAV
ncbi:MAG TPA: hypothetical protein VFG56_01430 [Candidatus Saccharimonadales bacterium]|nr:hypothetical protein [Candidatus Saccharimonadales bacterium]